MPCNLLPARCFTKTSLIHRGFHSHLHWYFAMMSRVMCAKYLHSHSVDSSKKYIYPTRGNDVSFSRQHLKVTKKFGVVGPLVSLNAGP